MHACWEILKLLLSRYWSKKKTEEKKKQQTNKQKTAAAAAGGGVQCGRSGWTERETIKCWRFIAYIYMITFEKGTFATEL